jgi:hypothetical protein
MNRKMLIGLGAVLTLSACAGDYYGPGPGAGPIAYDAYYDDAYGPFYDGYWGPGDVFFYSRGPHHRYIADRGHHFMHAMPGAGGPGNFHPVRGPGNFRGGAGFHGGGDRHH